MNNMTWINNYVIFHNETNFKIVIITGYWQKMDIILSKQTSLARFSDGSYYCPYICVNVSNMHICYLESRLDFH